MTTWPANNRLKLAARGVRGGLEITRARRSLSATLGVPTLS